MKSNSYMHLEHTISPVADESSEILILGSFPSVKSRESMFFYGHPKNRFWRVIAAVFDEPLPNSIEDKKCLILSHKIAVWDVIASCDILGSSDSSIKNVVPNNIIEIVRNSKIKKIYVNGNTAAKLYKKYIFPEVGIAAVTLPSTSPANAAWSFERLLSAWSAIKEK